MVGVDGSELFFASMASLVEIAPVNRTQSAAE
jgi:hypothetical protein